MVTLRYAEDFATDSLAGDPITGVYAGTETLDLILWAGDTLTAVTMSSSGCAWIDSTVSPAPDPDDGTFRVLLDNSDTANLAPGWYRIEIKITSGSEPQTCFECMLEVLPAAASGTAGATYCTYARVVDVCPWVGQLVRNSSEMQSDLGEYRADARRWLNRQLMARAEVRLNQLAEGHTVDLNNVYEETPDWLEYTWNEGESSVQEVLASLQSILDDDYVASTDPGLVDGDGTIAEICAYYTAYLIGRNEIGENGEDYRRFASESQNIATTKLSGHVAKVYSDDTDAPYLYLRP